LEIDDVNIALKGRKAIVTESTTGIGRATARFWLPLGGPLS
jgi:NAD(P)-dependent dehydrogenase (short-subunit alcohol dehydrogenase family)